MALFLVVGLSASDGEHQLPDIGRDADMIANLGDLMQVEVGARKIFENTPLREIAENDILCPRSPENGDALFDKRSLRRVSGRDMEQ